MHLHFSYKNAPSFPKEFGEDADQCVYYIEDYPFYTNERDENTLGDFKHINLFVGANNSGKSRFLRGLFKPEEDTLKISTDGKLINEKYTFLPSNYKKIDNKLKRYPHKLTHSIKKILDTKLENAYFHFTSNYNNYSDAFIGIDEHNTSIKDPELNEYLEKIKKLHEEILFVVDNEAKNKVYIPVYRSIKKDKAISVDSFEKATRNWYEMNNNRTVFTGLDLYDKVRITRNALKEQRKGFENFERFLSKHFFQNKDVEIISNLKEEHLIFYIDGQDREIHHIGDGIQSIILLLFPIYTARENTWFFIEEPENHLHPGLQRIFIETLLNDPYLKTKKLRYFFTTHSNHFLDTTIKSDDVAVFQFEKINEEKYLIKNNVEPKKEVLDVLGVNTSSVFLANTSLWVEGPTDRKYLSKFLKLYCDAKEKESLKEDIDFVFFEYGGNLITHYLFEDETDYSGDKVRESINSFALSNKIYLLADNDNVEPGSKKYERRENLKNLSDEYKFKYQDTIFTEIENLLPAKIIRGFMEQLVNGEEKKKLDAIKISREDYKNTRLGTFYEEKFSEVEISKFNAFKANSGTLKTHPYKIKLCNYFLASEIGYEELIEENDELHNIITSLYNFIKK